MLTVLVLSIMVACAGPNTKIAHRHELFSQGRICQDCARDNFANYQPCWKPKPGQKACQICVEHNCCMTVQDDCCCWHNKENCWKKCNIPLPPVK